MLFLLLSKHSSFALLDTRRESSGAGSSLAVPSFCPTGLNVLSPILVFYYFYCFLAFLDLGRPVGSPCSRKGRCHSPGLGGPVLLLCCIPCWCSWCRRSNPALRDRLSTSLGHSGLLLGTPVLLLGQGDVAFGVGKGVGRLPSQQKNLHRSFLAPVLMISLSTGIVEPGN